MKRLPAILDAVWQAHQEAHQLRVEHVDQLDDDPQRTLYAREDSLIMETVHVTLKGVARRAGVAWHGTYDKATCEVCGSTEDVRAWGWDASLLCKPHRAQADARRAALEGPA